MTAPSAIVGRPGGMGIGGKGAGIKSKLTLGLAWTSFALGVAAGSLLASTFLGGIVDNLLGLPPDSWGTPFVVLAVLFVFVCVDLFSDWVPNRLALYCVMVMPSVARSVNGKLGNNVESWANSVRDSLQGGVGSWLGTSSALGLAAAASACAYLVARRTMKAKAG